MSTFFFVMMLICMVAVLIVLIAGITLMGRGGELNKKYGNKLMQARVYLQGLALLFFALMMMARGQ